MLLTIGTNPNLKKVELRMANNNITDKEAEGIISAIIVSRNISLLDLSGNNLKEMGMIGEQVLVCNLDYEPF